MGIPILSLITLERNYGREAEGMSDGDVRC